MGMYTGLRAEVTVRPEWREAIQLLHTSRDREYERNGWVAVREEYPDMPGVAQWVANFGRYNFIPFGGLAYMPDDFSDAEDRESYSAFDPSTGVWRFCCSLKNYQSEIEFFVENVLRHVVQEVAYCESLYEEIDYDADWREQTTRWLEQAPKQGDPE